MQELDWKPREITFYMLDENTTVGGIVGLVRHERNADLWRGVVGVEGENYYTEWAYMSEAKELVQLLMREHGITVSSN